MSFPSKHGDVTIFSILMLVYQMVKLLSDWFKDRRNLLDIRSWTGPPSDPWRRLSRYSLGGYDGRLGGPRQLWLSYTSRYIGKKWNRKVWTYFDTKSLEFFRNLQEAVSFEYRRHMPTVLHGLQNLVVVGSEWQGSTCETQSGIWRFSDDFLRCSKLSSTSPTRFPWFSHGFPMVFPRFPSRASPLRPPPFCSCLETCSLRKCRGCSRRSRCGC